MPHVVTLCTGNAARSVMAGALLGDALLESRAVPACNDETKELSGRFEKLRPAVRELQTSLGVIASADDGIAVFVPPLPGR